MVLVQQGRDGETQGKGRLLSLFEYQLKEGKVIGCLAYVRVSTKHAISCHENWLPMGNLKSLCE